MKKYVYPFIEESMYYEKLDNGLDVYMIPKKDYNKAFAVFSTNYGGLDNCFIPFDRQELVSYPLGIAHFLEHKLFEMKDGKDASMRLSELGASSNAFTSFNQTSYLFSATSNIKECVIELLDFVQDPYFTDENVSKEQGIIEQEIKMYEDYPDFRAQMGVLKNMYEKNDIRQDIVGTVSSIKEITKEMLYSCYYTFYHPKNMQLFLIGNFDLDIIDAIKENQSKKEFKPFKEIVRDYKKDEGIYKDKEEMELDVYLPKLTIGIRLPFVKDDYIKKEVLISILMSIIFGDSSNYKEELLEKELINDTFGFYVDLSKTASYVIFMSDASNPSLLENRLMEMIQSISSFEIDNNDFERVKNSHVGKFIGMLNSLEAVATNYANYSFNNIDFFEMVKYIDRIALNDIKDIQKLFQEALYSKFYVYPQK